MFLISIWHLYAFSFLFSDFQCVAWRRRTTFRSRTFPFGTSWRRRFVGPTSKTRRPEHIEWWRYRLFKSETGTILKISTKVFNWIWRTICCVVFIFLLVAICLVILDFFYFLKTENVASFIKLESYPKSINSFQTELFLNRVR